MSGELITVDQSIVDVYGYERHKDARIVWNMILGIRSGDIFPPVGVFEYTCENGYKIAGISRDDDGLASGGHHRALAHLIEAVPLPIQIVGSLSMPTISEIKVVDLGIFMPRDGEVYRYPYEAIPSEVDFDYMLERLVQEGSVYPRSTLYD